LKQKKRAKEADRDRFRNSMNEEVQRLSDNLRKFESDVSSLRHLQVKIDAYINSSKEEDLERINEKIATLAERLATKSKELERMKPEAQKINKQISDQESQKKLIDDNLKLIKYKETIAKLEEHVAQLNADVTKVEGHDTYVQALEDLQKELGELNQKRSHHEGRRHGFVEQIHALKRKLKTPEYKNIDERHRVVVIKHETTQIAVADLDKYHAARKSLAIELS